MSSKDFYQILGVEKNADQGSIKKAYRELAKKYHPDRNPGNKEAEKKFKELNDAYETLKDDNKRASYDQYGSADFARGNRGHGAGGFEQDFNADFGDFADVFSNIFGFKTKGGGATQKRSSAVRGSDLRYNMTITLEESYHGKKTPIKYKVAVKCDACASSGSAGNAPLSTCNVCNGLGTVRAQQGFFTVETPCRSCNGSGQIIKNPCTSCKGAGRLEKEKSIAVSIPAGIEDETKIRISGEGEAGLRGGAAGDLYIFITIKKHDTFKRKKHDLYCDIPIKFITVALGGKIDVPCIDGSTAVLTINKATQSGSQFRLSGKGMPVIGTSNKFGDLYVKICVETPAQLTKKQEELLAEFDKESVNNSHAQTESFFHKVKSFWNDGKNT